MSNAIPSRLGQKDGAGDADALFLKVFGGEVLTAFEETNVAMSRHVVRSISSGKSAQFPATWKGTASYHTPGQELLGTTINKNERIITIDDLLVADRFIASIDEAKSHYDVRSIYSNDVGRALAQTFDKNVLQVMLLAGQASATVSGGNGGTTITDADANDADTAGVDSLIGSIFSAARYLDDKDVPDYDRYAFIKPVNWYAMINASSKLIHGDYVTQNKGGLESGVIYRVAGMDLVKSNNVPTASVATGPAAYQGTFVNTAAIVVQKGAVGTVKLLDLAVEMGWDMRRQGTLVIGKYALGHGILRPECAVEIETA